MYASTEIFQGYRNSFNEHIIDVYTMYFNTMSCHYYT